ncbi:SusC/RagA family TonB-linked outer membrane protein [Flavobacterium psychrophilum]|nr:SusC/RagA family TonB-linked outer membrane protein [Flavobacterium psychrophilum]
MKLKLNRFLVLLFALISQLALAQEKNATGVVTDASGLPLPGVNVVVKGTTRGASTSFDGTFKIQAQQGEILVFSFMGMNTVERPATKGMAVKLNDESTKLADVVVTALGIKRDKKSLGYATQEIKGNLVREGGNTGNVLSALSGKSAGLQIVNSGNFGGASSVVVRGMKSIQGNNQALIVIDGVAVNNSNNSSAYSSYDSGNTASDVNPNDIESINVLKGAAASALYGERASAGVIIITTKKGKSENGDNKWGVTFNSEAQIGNIDKSTFATYQKKYGAGYGTNNYGALGLDDNDVNGDGIIDHVAPTYDDASLGAQFDPNLSVYQWNAFDPTSPNFGKATPWVAGANDPSTFFETAITTSNSLTIEKGNENSSIVINYNNYNTTGVLPNSSQKKNTLSSRFSYKVNEKLTSNVYTSLTFQNTIGRNTVGYNDNIISGFRQWWQTNVDISEQKDAYFRSGGQNISWNIKGYNKPTEFNKANFWNNPYFDRYQNYQSDDRTRFFGYASLIYKLNKVINVTGRVSTDFWNQKDENRLADGSVAQLFGISQLSVSSGYFLANSSRSETNVDLFADYNKKFENKFSLGGLLGTNYRRNNYNIASTSTENGLIIPGLYAIRNSAGKTLPTQETQQTSSLGSAYAQLTLGYNDTYFLEGTSRFDKSSTLPKGSNVYFYPSVSGSIILSNLLKKDWLSFAKLRGNWAQVGKTALSYGIDDTNNIVGVTNLQVPVVSPRTFKNNANLKPEISTEIEAGLEAKFLNKRVGFDVSIYKTNSVNQIIRTDISSASGYAQKWINAGELENKGIELQLNLVPVKTNNFSWDISMNWGKNENKVIKLTDGVTNLLLGTAVGSVTFNATEGEAYGTIKGTDYVYSPNGDRVINPSTGRYVITASKNNVLGNIMPDWTGSIRNNLTYKNVNLSFLIDGQKGGSIYSGDMFYGTDSGLYESTLDIREQGYVLPGVNATANPNVFNTNTTAITAANRPENSGSINASANYSNKEFIYDASFIKIREASLNIRLPKKWFSNKIDASFGIFGRNLGILYKKIPFADPESGTSTANTSVQGNNLSRGYSIGAMPTVRTIGGSFTLKF